MDDPTQTSFALDDDQFNMTATAAEANHQPAVASCLSNSNLVLDEGEEQEESSSSSSQLLVLPGTFHPVDCLDLDLVQCNSATALPSPSSTTLSELQPTREPSNSKRPSVKHDYHDHSHDVEYAEILHPSCNANANCTDSSSSSSSSSDKGGNGGGMTLPFPERLHELLGRMDKEECSHIISWQPHGRCFVVHRPQEFVEKVLPKYFRQSKLTSFQRQLNIYGFCRLTVGRDRGGYYHEYFLRGRPSLAKYLVRTRVKGNGKKPIPSPETEPDFYSMEPCYEVITSSTNGKSTEAKSARYPLANNQRTTATSAFLSSMPPGLRIGMMPLHGMMPMHMPPSPLGPNHPFLRRAPLAGGAGLSDVSTTMRVDTTTSSNNNNNRRLSLALMGGGGGCDHNNAMIEPIPLSNLFTAGAADDYNSGQISLFARRRSLLATLEASLGDGTAISGSKPARNHHHHQNHQELTHSSLFALLTAGKRR